MTKVLQVEGRHVTPGAGGMAQWVTHLLYKHGDQKFDSQSLHKGWGQNGSPTVCPVHDQREGIPSKLPSRIGEFWTLVREPVSVYKTESS